MKIEIGTDGIDGVFGSAGHNAVMTFQENYKPTHNTHQYNWGEPDGIAGKNTLFAMDEALVDGWKYKEPDSSLQEARVRAFLRMLRVGEGTVGEKGYETLFGGKSFIKDFKKDWSDHPKVDMPFGKTTSSAAGAYQVMGYTWDDRNMQKAKQKHSNLITDFSPLSQDYFCIALLKYKDKGFKGALQGKVYDEVYYKNSKRLSAFDLILDNEIEKAIKVSAFEWASLPPGVYGQPAKSMKQAIALYEKYLKEEQKGESDLHLPNGFLENFQ